MLVNPLDLQSRHVLIPDPLDTAVARSGYNRRIESVDVPNLAIHIGGLLRQAAPGRVPDCYNLRPSLDEAGLLFNRLDKLRRVVLNLLVVIVEGEKAKKPAQV